MSVKNTIQMYFVLHFSLLPKESAGSTQYSTGQRTSEGCKYWLKPGSICVQNIVIVLFIITQSRDTLFWKSGLFWVFCLFVVLFAWGFFWLITVL